MAVDAERLQGLEGRLAEVSAALTGEREQRVSADRQRAELRDELIRTRAERDSTITRLEAQLDALRKSQAAASSSAQEAAMQATYDDLSLEDAMVGMPVSTNGHAMIDPDLELDEPEPVASQRSDEPDIDLDEPSPEDDEPVSPAAAPVAHHDTAEEPEAESESERAAGAVAVVETEAPQAEEEPKASETGPLEGEPEGDPTPCVECDATGSCERCSGRGKRFGMRCPECEGSGVCTACGGPGYVWPGESQSPHDPRHY
jgi:hypothetical protein